VARLREIKGAARESEWKGGFPHRLSTMANLKEFPDVPLSRSRRLPNEKYSPANIFTLSRDGTGNLIIFPV